MSQQTNTILFRHVALPLVFLTVTLLGGLRLSAENGTFIFVKPALICLIFAAILLILFFRARLVRTSDLFAENFSTLKNISNGLMLLTLFAASTQIFNSLLPEKGLAFWIIGFFFFWTLWNNLFVDFQARRLLQNLGSVLGLAFVVKYLVLASLAGTGEATWAQKIFESVMKEASLGLLDLPKFAPATGYIQFFTLAIYVIGLVLFSPGVRTESSTITSETTSNRVDAD